MRHRNRSGVLAGLLARVAVMLLPAMANAVPPDSSSAQARQQLPASLVEALRTSLEDYEEVRQALAADRSEGVAAGASRLADSLRLAQQKAAELDGEVTGLIEEAAAFADSMAAAADLASARETFGEVSRRLMLLAERDPRFTEGWHVFTCPMVDTFGKWMQPAEKLENPYMGSAMLACGSPTDWSVPAAIPAPQPAAADPPAREADRGVEPVLEPGIPGLRMVDVRDHKYLWREIEELQSWEASDRISIAEYRSKAIEKTVHFLELQASAADEFTATAAAAIAGLRESSRAGRLAADAGGGPASFTSDLEAAISRVTSLLDEAPRHQLFEPDCKKWLLKLAFGPREAKEAKEASAGVAEKTRD